MEKNENGQLKIISINIEKDKHFERLIPFLKREQPDIVLMQEVYERDVSYLEKSTDMKGFFEAISTYRGVENSKFGLLSLLRRTEVKAHSFFYRGSASFIPEIMNGEAANMARALLITEFSYGNQQYCVINTHFTWTPDGHASEKQNQDIEIMLQQLSDIPEFILCGDFNAPRGRPIFDKIAAKYKDNIPLDVITTIDKDLHKAGDLKLVVDGVFTTPKYNVDSLEVVSGLSDHCALLAKISISS